MRKDFNIFVEGLADECFFKQYLRHVFGEVVPDERIVVLKGWDNLKTEASALRMRSMTANGGVNLVIVDADNCCQTIKTQERWKTYWRILSIQTIAQSLIVGKIMKRNL